jgi:hypothetical protein
MTLNIKLASPALLSIPILAQAKAIAIQELKQNSVLSRLISLSVAKAK